VSSGEAPAKVHVLVADDDGLVRSALCAFLDGVDEVEVVGRARNGQEALDMALEHRPQVIVMDVSMPIMDGVEATRRILHALPSTRIVILTGHSDRERAEEARLAGAVAYVVKDREPSEIFAAIMNAVDTTW
jgi:DNA-binding NarL/FixJ family response regulator